MQIVVVLRVHSGSQLVSPFILGWCGPPCNRLTVGRIKANSNKMPTPTHKADMV